MPATLDLRKAHATRQDGDLLVVFTCINDERAMVLVPAYRPCSPWYNVVEGCARLGCDHHDQALAHPSRLRPSLRPAEAICEVAQEPSRPL